MMPDAIPARWVGTAVIASEVIGVRHNPASLQPSDQNGEAEDLRRDAEENQPP
jgi:hypothetical protein